MTFYVTIWLMCAINTGLCLQVGIAHLFLFSWKRRSIISHSVLLFTHSKKLDKKARANRYTFLLRPVVVDGQSISFFFLRQSVLLFLNIEAPPSRQGASYDITTHLELGFTIYDNDSTTNNRRKNIFPKRAN
jgi:hypothetical protein